MTDWAAYKRKQREARREAGLVSVTVWVRPEDRQKVHELAEQLASAADED